MKQRTITAIFIVAIAVILYILPGKIGECAIALTAGMLGALAYKETLGLKESHNKYPKLIEALGLIALELVIFNNITASYLYNGINYAVIGLILLLLAIPTIFDEKKKYTTADFFYLIGTIILIGIFFNITMLIFIGEKELLLYLVLIATMTDTFAMLIGCLIGKHKLIPKVSPKKSIEGSVAGSVVATAVGTIYYVNVISNTVNIFGIILMTLVLSILGQLGDLFFSKIKRENEIKDFSNLMPGHGGVLDRFDSLTFIMFGYIIIMIISNMFR